MAGIRKSPTLRKRGASFVTDVYRADGRRTTISFGTTATRTEGQIHATFGKWLDLYSSHPRKALSFRSPYDAVARAVNPSVVGTVGELVDAYLQCESQYLLPLRDGRANPELARVRQVRKFLEPFEDWPVADFEPEDLKAIQTAMVEYRYFRHGRSGKPVAYTRGGINRGINLIHRIWRWGIGREITTPAQAQRLREVRPLRIGRTKARDSIRRPPVTEEELQRVRENLNSVVADMITILWHTAMRPSEVCRMRPFDILRDDPDCWLYLPGRDISLTGDHKTARFQRIRVIPLTSTVQKILTRRITRFDAKKNVFRPADAVAEMLKNRFRGRKTPLSCGNRPGTNRRQHPMLKPGAEYTSKALSLAVKRACNRAGVARFTPYDLRRTAATRVRSKLSKEDAKLLLGHVSTDTTEIYLLDEVQEAIKMAKRLDAVENGGG